VRSTTRSSPPANIVSNLLRLVFQTQPRSARLGHYPIFLDLFGGQGH
jgi:hypothetical protein